MYWELRCSRCVPFPSTKDWSFATADSKTVLRCVSRHSAPIRRASLCSAPNFHLHRSFLLGEIQKTNLLLQEQGKTRLRVMLVAVSSCSTASSTMQEMIHAASAATDPCAPFEMDTRRVAMTQLCTPFYTYHYETTSASQLHSIVTVLDSCLTEFLLTALDFSCADPSNYCSPEKRTSP